MTDQGKSKNTSIEEWYATLTTEALKRGIATPAWPDLSPKEARAWTLAYVSQLEMSIRLVDAMELTMPGLMGLE